MLRKLLEILNRLVMHGNTVVVIEHNMDVIKSADYVLDFGPEGGNGGGKLVAKGTPEQVANMKGSHTGTYLKKYSDKNEKRLRKGAAKSHNEYQTCHFLIAAHAHHDSERPRLHTRPTDPLVFYAHSHISSGTLLSQ